MKQKYTIHKDIDNHSLVIKEYAELNKEILSLLCEESYPEDVVAAAIGEGKEKLIAVLRTRNMYPPGVYAGVIADIVITLYGSEGDQSTEIFFDDKEFFEGKAVEMVPDEDSVDADEDIDTVLEDDIDDVYEDKKIIKDLKSTLKVADEDSVDTDDDV
jgi:hypothetical protein